MTVLKWDTCQFCDKPILLWSNGKWYNAMSKAKCDASADNSSHIAITPVEPRKRKNYV